MARQKARIIDGPPKMMERIKRYEKAARRYSKMSLDCKVAKLEALKKKRKTIEGKLGDTDVRIGILRDMPDMARREVEEREDVTAVLCELREGKLDVKEFSSDLPKRVYLYNCLYLLEKAGYIEFMGDISNFDVKVTEAGYAFQYDGRFEEDGR